MKYSSEKIILILIVLIAALFRFTGINWDSSHHLHPDERFLTMVTLAMQLPATVASYLDPQTSAMNPRNVGYEFYVYGAFPLVFTKIMAVWQSMDSYELITLLGRFLTGIADLVTLVTVYKLAKLFFPETAIPRLAAFMYGVAVLPIQLAHFYAVDPYLNMFMFLSFYFMVKFAQQHSAAHKNGLVQRIRNFFSRKEQSQATGWGSLLLSGASLGLAIACKINAVILIPLLGIIFLATFFTRSEDDGRTGLKLDIKAGLKHWETWIFVGLAFLIVSYLALRLGSPYYFASANILDFRLDAAFVQNITQLKSFEGPDVWYPPAIQWIPTQPIIFSLKNLIVFGLGVPYALLMFSGIGLLVYSITKQKKRAGLFDYIIIFTILWVIGFFLYQSSQFVKALRYFIFLYPFYALFAGYGLHRLIQAIDTRLHGSVQQFIARLGVYIALLIWPLMFISIYTHPHSRVTASEWMYDNIPSQSILLTEHWDDGLPLPMTYPENKTYISKEMPVFGMDTPEKWQQIDALMQEGDYYVLSSNRGWGSMPRVPEKYPQMKQFYDDLFAEKLGYRKVAEFTSYPRLELSGRTILELPDDWADETFTVYDHPKVMIYKNNLKGKN